MDKQTIKLFRFHQKQKKKEIRAIKKLRSLIRKSRKKTAKSIKQTEQNIGKAYYLQHSGHAPTDAEQYRLWCETIADAERLQAENDRRIQTLESEIRLLKQELSATKKSRKSNEIPEITLDSP